MKLHIINGPNLNLLGRREPAIYGNVDFDSYYGELKKNYPHIQFSAFQSNIEGELINSIHNAGFDADGIILNAGGYTHTSVAIGDAIAAVPAPVIEVHISNIFSREDYRHHSLLSKNCEGIITGFGLLVYELAVIAFAKRKK